MTNVEETKDLLGGGRPMQLSVKSLTTGLEFHGEVQSKRQHYYILSDPRRYFVMSLSTSKQDAGNFNLVSRAAVEKLYRRLRGQQGVTVNAVLNRSRDRRAAPTRFAVLNMLYVLVASDRASIDGRYRSRELFFNVKG